MTTEQKKQWREEFEQFCESIGVFLLSKSDVVGGYIADSTEIRWEAFMEAKQSSAKEIEELRRKLAEQQAIHSAEYQARQETLKHPSVGHDYWQHYWRIRYEQMLSEARKQEREECSKIADSEASIEGIAQRIAAAIRAKED